MASGLGRSVGRITNALLATLVALVPAAGAARQATAPSDPVEAAIGRCFELRRSTPQAAIAMAEGTLAARALDPQQQVKLLSCLGMARAIIGDAAGAAEAVDRVEAQLKAHSQAPDFLLRAYSNAGATLHIAGQVHRALDFYNRAYEAARREDQAEAQIASLINIGILYGEELGAFAEAERQFASAQALSDAAALPNPLLAFNRGMNHVRAGNDALALPQFEQAAQLAAQDHAQLVARRARSERLALLARAGKVAGAEGDLEEIARQQQAQTDPSGAAMTRIHLSRLLMAQGDAAGALRQADAALQLASPTGFRAERREALRARMSSLQALGHYRLALQASQELAHQETADLRAQNLAGVAALQDRLDDDRRARDMEKLRNQASLQALKLANERQLRNGAVAACCMLAALSLGFALYQRRVNTRLRLLSTTDGMTGLLNRRTASARMAAMPTIATARRRHVAFLIDVDHFKDINDRHGHAAGDAILVEVGKRLRACCRPGDLVARWGGEEFLIACQGLDLEHAAALAERLRAAIASAPFDLAYPAGEPALTASVGFSCWPFFPDAPAAVRGGFEEAVALADRAMYAAKYGGRDAWAGLWGRAGGGCGIGTVLADPEPAVRSGEVTAVASRLPLSWDTGARARAA